GVPVLLEPARALLHDLGVEPELFAHPVVHVAECPTGVPVDPRAKPRSPQRFTAEVLQPAGDVAIDQVLARSGPAARGIRLLAADEGPLVEPPPEVLRGFEHVIEIRDETGAEASRPEDLGQGVLRLRDRAPAGRTGKIALEIE